MGEGEGSGPEGSGGVAEQKGEERRRERKPREQLLEGRIQSNPTSKHYLQWKENILRLARENVVEAES